MAGDNKIHMPGSFGGIMRYDEEYETRFKITPTQVIVVIVVVIVFVLGLNMFWPVAAA